MRSTPGSSFGPMTISATTAMRTNSLHPMSNIKNSAHAKPFSAKHRPPRDTVLSRPASFPSVLGRVLPRRTCCSDGLAADIRPRRRGRRSAMIDRLHRFSLLRHLVVVLHALLEGLDALRHVAHQIGNLAAAEQQQDHCDHHDPVPNAKRTHPATLQNTRPATRPNLYRKLGSGGVKNKDLSRVKSLLTRRIAATVNRPRQVTPRRWNQLPSPLSGSAAGASASSRSP